MMNPSYLSISSEPFPFPSVLPKSPREIDTKGMEEEVLVYTVVDSDRTPWPMRTTLLFPTKRHDDASRAERTKANLHPSPTLSFTLTLVMI